MIPNTEVARFAARLGRLEEERAALVADIRDVYAEAKAQGLTPGALRKALKIHRLDADKRKKHDAEQMDLELYLAALEGADAMQEAAE